MIHIYQGFCPDELQPDSRDPECPACRVEAERDALRTAYAVAAAIMRSQPAGIAPPLVQAWREAQQLVGAVAK